jgi:hypothetical protein
VRLITLVIGLVLSGCASPPPTDDGERAAALAAAKDTVKRAWKHEVAVDSVVARGDTTVVWVSPRDWMATDAPHAGVSVLPGGRIAAIQWIMGG